MTETVGHEGAVAPADPDTAARDPVILIQCLRKERGQADVKFVLTAEEVRVGSGEFAAIFGASGCGKSTLLDQIGLILAPTDVDRFEIRDPKSGKTHDIRALWKANNQKGLARVRATAMGYVLQTGGLLPFLTVEQNVALPLRHLGVPIDREWIGSLLERMEISDFARRKPGSLSGGQRQRVAIVRALSHRPGLILADEPTAAVDKKRAKEIVEQFKEVAREQGAAVVMVTHDRGLISSLSDRVYEFELSSPESVAGEGKPKITEIRSRCIMTSSTAGCRDSDTGTEMEAGAK